ncbi:sensor domain-containing diguanylate cyclase [Marinobacter segnicrescens]|uniref:diguanylate cyclase n=1 Tax=Marinobacter segnicrescens TaxID=430453 RepID=A0A1I0DH82_9GAMM|nr:sensor domain-containing diguanylate cyclase [Marinobacter segnicrescens]SET31769.1 PAS domain S-box-containing protein/diguanylate cyclase (GGDEF) domain-containing protein [Marinobacter segnicrescens]
MDNAPQLSPEARLQAILDGTRAGTWEWNLDTGEVLVNHRWAEMLGYEPDELMPMTYELWQSLSHPSDRERAKALMARHLRGETPYFDCVVRLRHKRGHWRWIHTRGRRLSDSDPAINWVCGTHLDISGERETQHRLQRLAESLPGVIYTFVMKVDGSFGFSYVSQKSIDFYGIPPELALQDPDAIFDIIVNEDLGHVHASIERSARNMEEWRCQYRVQLAGEVRWMEGVAQPEKDEVGQIIWHGMITEITERKQLELELERLSITDELTGLYNRRHMLRTLEEQIARAKRYQEVFSVIALDVDHFKQINDSWGHLVGDQVLIQFAGVLSARVRRTDVVARTGGEEFLILLPNTTNQDAHRVAEALREATEREDFRNEDSETFTVTMSGGVVTWDDGLASIRELLSRCDQRLYQAKREGRNRIVVSDQP